MKPAKLSTSVLVGLAACVLVLVAILLVEFDGTAPAQPSSPLRTAVAPTQGASATLEGFVEGSPASERVREPSQELEPRQIAPPTESSTSAVALTDLVIAGTLVLVGQGEPERKNSNGHMYLAFDYGHGVRNVSVAVTRGAWRAHFAELPDGTYVEAGVADPEDATHFSDEFRNSIISVRSVNLNTIDSITGLDAVDRFVFGEQEALIRLRLVVPVEISVEDAVTGAPLSQVTILIASGRSHEGAVHPEQSLDRVIVMNASSPFELDPDKIRHTTERLPCLVGSPGFAWKSFELDLAAEKPQRVQLERGGELEVHLGAGLPTGDFLVNLYADDSPHPLGRHVAPDSGPVLFTGLVPGQYEVRYELARWSRATGAVSLASKVVGIVAGERAQVALNYTPLSARSKGSVSGTLVLPEEWQIDPLGAYVFPIGGAALESAKRSRLLDQLRGRELTTAQRSNLEDSGNQTVRLEHDDFKRDPKRADTFAFDLGELTTGTYELRLDDPEYKTTFQVGPEGRSDVLLEVPEPVWVTVRVVDASTGADIPVSELSWRSVDQRYQGTTAPPHNRFDHVSPKRSEYRVRVPRTRLLFMCPLTVDLSQESEEIQAEEGLQVTLEVTPTCAALLELRHAGRLVPWPKDAMVLAQQLDGHGESDRSVPTPRGIRLTVDEPGRYRILPPWVPGYDRTLPMIVTLREGQVTEVVIRLTRTL